MKNYKLLGFVLLFLCTIAAACSGNSNAPGASGDWASYFVVWKGNIYVATNEVITQVENEIGTIEEFSDDENYKPSKVFSNKYPVGTKLYKIPGTSTADSFAIEVEGKYIVAEKSGKYGKH